MLIIGGYLRGKYAQNKPLAVSASICFEQSYSGVDGDSASSTEIYAILSSLSELPIRQDIAVTGSVNQKGEIQPIGGVNQKIEGHYEVCKAKGLTGTQGVIIPHQNIKDLMLKKEVIQSVRKGKFHIYPVKLIDEGIEILMGVPAGEIDEKGNYPKVPLITLWIKSCWNLPKISRNSHRMKGFPDRKRFISRHFSRYIQMRSRYRRQRAPHFF